MAFPQLLSTKIPSNRFQCDISLLLLLGFDLPACRQLLLAHGHLPDHCLELWLLSACLEPPQYIFVGLEVGFIADKLEGVHQRACRGDVGQGNSGSHEALLGSFREVRFQRGKGFRQVGLGLVVRRFVIWHVTDDGIHPDAPWQFQLRRGPIAPHIHLRLLVNSSSHQPGLFLPQRGEISSNRPAFEQVSTGGGDQHRRTAGGAELGHLCGIVFRD
mmetsp:Transcript_58560/g.174375  ORF Transcript_58560/g.174375 Transcript_58560/m.174375 type:complete len:216 (+) Transcript_58560:32-679(+)